MAGGSVRDVRQTMLTWKVRQTARVIRIESNSLFPKFRLYGAAEESLRLGTECGYTWAL